MKLNLIGPICSTGYGITTTNIAVNLDSQGHDLCLFPIGNISIFNSNHTKTIEKLVGKNPVFHHDGICLRVWHQFDLAQSVGKGPYIAWPIFELDYFTDRERHHLEYPDHIIVCSEWAKEVLLNHINKKKLIDVVELGVDTDIFSPVKRQENQPYTFINAGKWELRKGHDVLVDWFNKAFNKRDNVQLVMLCQNPFLSPQELNEWKFYYKNSKLGDKIHIIDQSFPLHENIANIMRQCDCGIFPSRAEGWNLEALEMMALNKPVIITDYSAHTQFCHENNSFLIKINHKEDADDGKWFTQGGRWASLGAEQEEQTIEYMRKVYKERITTNEEGLKKAQQLSWANSARKLFECIYSPGLS